MGSDQCRFVRYYDGDKYHCCAGKRAEDHEHRDGYGSAEGPWRERTRDWMCEPDDEVVQLRAALAIANERATVAERERVDASTALLSLRVELWEGVRAHELTAPKNGKEGERLIHAYCGGIARVRNERDAALEQVAALTKERAALAQGIEDLLLVATTDADADGFITAYHFKTGALHRLLGLARNPGGS